MRKRGAFLGYKSALLQCAGAAALLLPLTAYAQSAAPGASVILDPIDVDGQLTPEDVARRRLQALPGGTSVIADHDLSGRTNVTLSDALSEAPGVIVQNFFGGNDQPRVQIRGSGMQQSPTERGLLVLQNGLPINRADGSYIVGLTDPRQAEITEIYRGYTANRLGATVLGGALNFTSPTGISQPGAVAQIEMGSFGQLNTSLQAGGRSGDYDGLMQLSYGQRDGFRDYNESDRVSFDANAGIRISPNISTRFFAGYTDLGFDVAGPLNRTMLESNPRRVASGPTVIPGVPPRTINPGPNVWRDQPHRDATQYRIGNRTAFEYGAHLVDFAVGYTYTDDTFQFPISSGIRSTEGGDVNTVLRYAYNPDSSRPLPLFETTASYAVGSADRRYYQNNGGQQGRLFGANTLDADTLSLSAGLNIPLGDFTLSPAVAYAWATRDSTDTFGAATRPTSAFNPMNPNVRLPDGMVAAGNTSYSRDYEGFSPSLGLSYRPTENHMFFGAVSRSFEPPTHDDLLATVNGTPNSSAGRPNPANPRQAAAAFSTPNLDAQTATTVEAGWRGKASIFSWDGLVYYSWVRDELLSLRDETGASLGAVNADKTTHFGVELGLNAALTEKLSARVAYTYQDFRFDNDPVRGDNRLAGAPQHMINAMVQYSFTDAFRVQTEVQWSPTTTPVDNMNTLYAPSYVVVDLRASYDITERIRLYGEARNVFDEKYASSTLVVDQAQRDQAAFLPGDGRAFYAGMRVKF